MNILSIETSCDETAVSVVVADGGVEDLYFDVLGNALFSQIKTHTKYGGVFPMMAKREHAQNLPHLLISALKQANEKLIELSKLSEVRGEIKVTTEPYSLYGEGETDDFNKEIRQIRKFYPEEKWQEVKKILEREDGLYESLRKVLENVEHPDVDIIAVTFGPGLEPALWVGISCAKALGLLWDIPVVPTNHMEGHIFSVLLNKTEEFSISNFQFSKENTNAKNNTINFPALALLISGGHTELVQIENWSKYKIIGQTRDDAVGEAFDKVARMLKLPYPGGPQISSLAEKARKESLPKNITLPRPMIHSNDFDFSFSGLKTAVLYHLRDHPEITDSDYPDIAREFEDAVVDVLVSKTKKALLETGAETLIIAGGVISNKKIRQAFKDLEKTFSQLKVEIPTHELATDNAVMIALAGYITIIEHPEMLKKENQIKAEGNVKLS